MKEPNKLKCRELLESLHCDRVPMWTTKQIQEVYEEFFTLYYHWFRQDIKNVEEK